MQFNWKLFVGASYCSIDGSALAQLRIVGTEPVYWGVLGQLGADRADAVMMDFHLDGNDSQYKMNLEAVRQLFRNAVVRGSHVRLATAILRDPRGWPRLGIEARRWLWETVIAYPQSGRHINVLELRAVLSSIKWRLRTDRGVRVKFAHLCDSQVCIGVLVKGRSSSLQVSSVLKQINALILSSGICPLYA